MRLDLGCGMKPKDGYVGVDRVATLPGVIEADLLAFPWPWPDESVSEVWCHHVFEHVPGKLRGQWMDELWRVLLFGSMATLTVPAWDSPGAVQDFTHEWPPVCAQSFLYFNRDARKMMGLEHYDVTCHFLYQTRAFTHLIPQLEITLMKA